MLKYKRLYLDSMPLDSPKRFGDAGYDLPAYGDYTILPGEIAQVNTGIAVEIPYGFMGMCPARSGLRYKFHINTFGDGIIDAGYRGELKLLLINNNNVPIVIQHGDKVAQLVIVPIFNEPALEVDELSDTERGENGFGSTGLRDLLPGALFTTAYPKD